MDTTDKPKIKIKAVGDTVSGIVYVTEKGSYLIDVNFRGYNDKHPDCSTTVSYTHLTLPTNSRV